MARAILTVAGIKADPAVELRALGYDPKLLRGKVVLIGAPGVGKSALIAALIGDPDAVLHDVRAEAVTSDVTRVVLRGLSSGANEVFGDVLLYDIPGLIEAGETNLARNKACVQKAMTELSDLPTVVIYVATVAGGRPQQGCMQGLTTALEYVTGKRAKDVTKFPDVVVAVVNQVPKGSRKTAADIAALHTDVAAKVRAAGKLDDTARVLCLPRCNEDDMYDAASPGFKLLGERMSALLVQECKTATAKKIPATRNVTLEKEHDAAEKDSLKAEREEADKSREKWKALAVVAGVAGTVAVCYACPPVAAALAAAEGAELVAAAAVGAAALGTAAFSSQKK